MVLPLFWIISWGLSSQNQQSINARHAPKSPIIWFLLYTYISARTTRKILTEFLFQIFLYLIWPAAPFISLSLSLFTCKKNQLTQAYRISSPFEPSGYTNYSYLEGNNPIHLNVIIFFINAHNIPHLRSFGTLSLDYYLFCIHSSGQRSVDNDRRLAIRWRMNLVTFARRQVGQGSK